MKKKAPKRRGVSISIIGPGNLGTALALTLHAAGYEIRYIVSRPGSKNLRSARALAKRTTGRAVELASQALDTDVVWITVPDDAIAGVAGTLAKKQAWKGKLVFHSSGALTSEEISALRNKGAVVASVHPMMTFPRGKPPNTHGVTFAVEGDKEAVAMAKQIVGDLGGKLFRIDKRNKGLYHAFGSFASPLVIALLAAMEQVAKEAGIEQQRAKEMMYPLLSRTLHNYSAEGASSAFTGPLARGDVKTVRHHLAQLKRVPEAREVYLTLATLALKRLPVKNREDLTMELTRAGRLRK